MPDETLPLGVSIVDTSEVGSLLPSFVLKVAQLNIAKRGDFVRLLLKFTETIEGADPNPRATEFITCVVTGKGTNGLLRCKVYSLPEKTRYHSVTYGDELTLSDRHVMTHEVSTDQIVSDLQPFLTGIVPAPVPVNAEDAKLRQAVQNLPPFPPQAGHQYWLRNGVLITVWTFQSDKGYWLGGTPDGSAMEWASNGAHATGNRDLDIVKDPNNA